jgi:hypothetical protein
VAAVLSATLLPPTRWIACCIDRLNQPHKPVIQAHSKFCNSHASWRKAPSGENR